MEEEGRCGNCKQMKGIRREDRKKSFGCLAIIFVIGLIIGLTGNICNNCQNPNHNSTEPKLNITLDAPTTAQATTAQADSCPGDNCPGRQLPS